MDQDNLVRIEHLIEDPKITNPKPQELIMRTLNRLYELAWLAGIGAKTINRSLEAFPVRLGSAFKRSNCGS